MAGKEFAVKGAICMCKYGAAPAQLNTPENQFFKLNGSKLTATTKTIGSVFGPAGFGVCNMNPLFPRKCAPAVTQWSNAYTGIKTSYGGNPLTDKSKATCSCGCPDCIEFIQPGQIPVPGVKQMKQATKAHQGELDCASNASSLSEHPIKMNTKLTPGSSPHVLIKAVEGDKESFVGAKVKYNVTKYNVDNPDTSVKSMVRWCVEVGGKRENIDQTGDTIELTIKEEWNGKEIAVMPFINKPAEEICIKTKIILELILLFWVDDKGKGMMSAAAETRLVNIKKSKWYNALTHKVHCPPIQRIDEIIEITKNYIKKYGGKEYVFTREIGVFSHSGTDGPICYQQPVSQYPLNDKRKQMSLAGWGIIDFNWKESGSFCVFYGCRSGLDLNAPENKDSKCFAKDISELPNFTNVEVFGQSSSAFPSFFPDYRVTTTLRSTGVG